MTTQGAEYTNIFDKLTRILGADRVKKGKAPLHIIVNPKTTDDVSRILKLAESESVPVFPAREMALIRLDPQTPAAIMMNTKDMNGIFEIDEENLAVTVGPGVLWKDLYNALSKRKYSIGAYPDSSTLTVGDWIDWGGAGIGSYKHGFAGDQIRTLEIVLPDGRIIDTGFKKVLPNSSGYNLNGLFVGADSTLGIITKVTLKMFPKPEGILPLYYVFKEPRDMNKALAELTKQKVTPLNVSFFNGEHVQTLRTMGREIPQINGIILNITLGGLKSVITHNEQIINQLMESHGAQKVESNLAKTLWRERFFEARSKGSKVKPMFGEVLVPLSSLDGLIKDTQDLFSGTKAKGALLGILSDRSTVSFTPYLIGEGKIPDSSKVHIDFIKKLGELSMKYHGRPVGSALYLVTGIRRIYGEGVNTIMDIKSAIDPHDIMNPQVLK
jgi:FAD/FMN-containing dehydrogenase